MPCHREHVTGSIPFLQRTQAHSWCAKYAGILPSSLVSQEFSAGLYRGDQMGGLILAPPPLNRIFCAYPGDGNSMGHGGCQTKCPVCPERPPGYHGPPCRTWDCSYSAEQLGSALRQGSHHHNEVVIDALLMHSHVPHSILGFFYMHESTRLRAAQAHRAFLSAFKLHAAECPLLHFSLADAFSRDQEEEANVEHAKKQQKKRAGSEGFVHADHTKDQKVKDHGHGNSSSSASDVESEHQAL